MREYIVSLITAALLAALLGVLSPDGEGGTARYLRLLTALFLLCVIIAPVEGVSEATQGLLQGDADIFDSQESESDYSEQFESTLSSATGAYLTGLLTETIRSEFSIPDGQVRLSVRWSEDGKTPERISVILSGGAIWKDPEAIENFVRKHVGCECVTAIE